MKTLMHTIKPIRFYVIMRKKTCSDDINHLNELIVSQVTQIL